MNARAGDRHGRAGGHEEAWLLLPWYVNGTLDEGERAGVEDHLAACGICREEVRYWGEAASLLREDGELAVSPEAGLERLRARLAPDRVTQRPPTRRWSRVPGRWRAVFQGSPGVVRWALAAQLVVIVVLAGLLGRPALRPASPPGAALTAPVAHGAFRTLADPQPAAAANGAPKFQVMFAPQAREREIRGALISIGGRIVDGPSPSGVYTIAVAQGEGEADPAAVLRSLRSLPHVVFAEPAVGEP